MAKRIKRRRMDIGLDEWQDFIKPYARIASETSGFIARLTEVFKEHGYDVKSQLVYQWLVNDENKRVQPRVGAGLVLMRLLPIAMERLNKTQ